MLILRISKKNRHFLCRILWSADITILMFITDALVRHFGRGA
jgi:hypothetical protein